MSRNIIMVGVGILFGIALIAGFALARPYTFRGSEIDPPVPAHDFSLLTAGDTSFRLSDQKGKIVLIFFGYTTCPDICPATLGEFKQVSDRLGRDAEEVRFVFITVDPERDTPERISQYVHNFDPAFIGVTGTESDLEPVWKNYGVYRAISKQDSAVGYLVDHSTRAYLVDPDGNLRLTYSFGTPVDDILQDVRYLIKHKDS